MIPGMCDLMEKQSLPSDLVHVFATEDRLGHTSEIGEFVDHPPQVAHLAHDGAGQSLEGFGFGPDFLAEPALKPLGGELNGRQRVLDLVRDAARNVRPCSAPLVAQLIGNVVKRNDRAVLVAHALRRERPLARAGRNENVGLPLFAGYELVEFRRDFGKAGTLKGLLPGAAAGSPLIG